MRDVHESTTCIVDEDMLVLVTRFQRYFSICFVTGMVRMGVGRMERSRGREDAERPGGDSHGDRGNEGMLSETYTFAGPTRCACTERGSPRGGTVISYQLSVVSDA